MWFVKDKYFTSQNDKKKDFLFLESCEKCGTNWKKDKFEVDKLPKNSSVSQTLLYDFVISEELYYYLQNQGVKVEHLQRIYHQGRPAKYFYFIGEQVAPRIDMNLSNGIKVSGQCDLCFRNGFYDTRNSDPEYFIPELFGSKFRSVDILTTWENFGPSNLSSSGNRIFKMSRPRIIISQRTKNAIEEYDKNHGLTFFPIMGNENPLA